MTHLNVQMTWVIITVVICAATCMVVVRLIYLHIMRNNIFHLRTLFASIRFLQSANERKRADIVSQALSNTFKENPFGSISFIQPQFIAATMSADHTAIEINPMGEDVDNPSHWPIFRVARDGEIVNQGNYIVPNIPTYDSVAPQLLEVNVNQQMSSAEVLRNAIQPLGMNNSLNIQRNDNSGGLSGGMSGYMGNSGPSVPLDRPLFINTTMSAQQRIDLYRMLVEPPQDSEPTLTFRIP